MMTEEFKTAAKDLAEAIDNICLGSIQEVVKEDALKALIDNWNDQSDVPLGCSDSAARAWVRRFMEGGDPLRADMECLLVDFVETIDVTGGLVKDRKGNMVPVADEEWADLASIYLSVCEILKWDPKIDTSGDDD